MRKLVLCGFLFSLLGGHLFSDATFSGEATLGVSAYPVLENDGSKFESPLNPANILGVRDLKMNTDLLFKLASREQRSAFALWVALKPYDLAQALFAAATDSPEQTTAVADALTFLGPAPSALEVLRAYVQLYAGQAVTITIGRQSLVTGYGFGWNPMDFFSSTKDPSDPDRELKGVEALSVQYSAGNLLLLRLAGIYRPQPFSSGVDIDQLQGALQATLSLPSFELKLSGLYKQGGADSEDPYVPAMGLGFFADLAGLGLYGEAALLKGSRVPLADAVGLNWQNGWLFSALLGLQYTFTTEVSFTFEYFYNGEGYSLAQRRDYEDALDAYNISDGIAPAEYLMLFRPGYFARQYLMLNLQIPVYAISTDIDLTVLYSPDSRALQVLPGLTFNFSGGLALEMVYAGMFSLQTGQFDEASFSPVRHTLQISARYSF